MKALIDWNSTLYTNLFIYCVWGRVPSINELTRSGGRSIIVLGVHDGTSQPESLGLPIIVFPIAAEACLNRSHFSRLVSIDRHMPQNAYKHWE